MVSRKLLSIVLCSAAGVTTALVAWYPGHWLVVLLALPLLWGRAPDRWSAGALWVGYYLTGARDIPQMCARFFAGHGELPGSVALAMGAVFWLAQAALLAAPWVLLKPKADASAHAILWRAALALLVGSVPPIGIIGWLSPLHVASVLYPAMRWIGLALAFALLVSIAASRTVPVAFAAVALLYMVLLARLLADIPSAPSGWMAINTRLGKLDQSNYSELYRRTQQAQMAAQQAFVSGARVVILPEEVVGLWRPATRFWWQDFLSQLDASGRTLVLGVDLPVSSEPVRYTDSAVVTGAGVGRFDSRQPVPAGLWRPGAAVSAVLGSIKQPYLTIDGRRAAFSICYEDFLWWPHWRLLFDRPDVLVGMSNGWFNSDLAVARIQRQSVQSVARLAGVPLLRAVNQQSSTKG
jgi:apolipoprotein N-acyltransferase